jgi:hypothetical protein
MSAGIDAKIDGSGAIQVGGTDVITISSAGAVAIPQSLSVAGSLNTPNTFGFKNRIMNGAMVIDQRNNGASVTITNTAATTYIVDRWAAYGSQASKFSVQQNAGSVTPPQGYIKYLGATSLSAYTVGASENFTLSQNIEGFNVADLGWGSASAQSVTLSFWVRSSLTGTFGGSVINNAVNRSYVFSFTVSAANTWEYKTITIAGDTSGTWVTDNGIGIRLSFGLGVGSTLSTTAGSWSTGFYVSATGATSVVGTNGATFYITGVQLEKGSTATSFDYRPYGQELALCQRYFYRNGGSNIWQSHTLGVFTGSLTLDAPFYFPVPFRASPSLTVNTIGSLLVVPGGYTISSLVIQDGPSTNSTQLLLRATTSGSPVLGNAARIYSNNNASASLDFSAEL